MSEAGDSAEVTESQILGTVYFLRSGVSNVFKIGRTSGDVERRIKQLNTGNPHPLTLFDSILTVEPSFLEAHLHRTLRLSKHYGNGGTEFFEIEPDTLRCHIDQARQFMRDYIQARNAAEKFRYCQSEDREVVPSELAKAGYRRLLELRREIEAMRLEYQMIEYQLKAELGTASVLQDIATWKSSLLKRFDSQSFQAEHPDLHSKYLKPTLQRRFTLDQK